MRELRKAAIYCRSAETYGSFEPKDEHNTITYQTGSAMTFITDNKLDYYGLYVDEMDSMSSLMALNRECKAGNFDLANEMLTTKTIKKDDQEPDYFPMAVCGVCGKKLTFKRSRSIYMCDRHTGEFANEKKLEHAPKISVEDLRAAVSRQYNEQLADMK